jgi:asparagine synthase (glutamine-hydrolysing)
MLEGVDRLIDLVGPRTTALSGASEADLLAAVGRCDVASLRATDGHFAITSRDGKTVRLARTIGIPVAAGLQRLRAAEERRIAAARLRASEQEL